MGKTIWYKERKYYEDLEAENKKKAHELARQKLQEYFKKLSQKGDVIIEESYKCNDLGYKYYSVTEEYTGYKIEREKNTYTTGYSGWTDSNGTSHISRDTSTDYDEVMVETKKSCIESAYYKVVKKGETSTVKELEKDFNRYAEAYYDYNSGRSLDKPNKKISILINVQWVLSILFCLAYLLTSCRVMTSSAYNNCFDLKVFYLIPHFLDVMLSVPDSLVYLFFGLSSAIVLLTFLIELLYYKKFYSFRMPAIYLIYLIFALLSLMFGYWCGGENNPIMFSIVILNASRLALCVTIIIMIILFVCGYSKRKFKKACKAVEARYNFVTSGELSHTIEVLNKIRSYTINI